MNLGMATINIQVISTSNEYSPPLLTMPHPFTQKRPKKCLNPSLCNLKIDGFLFWAKINVP